MSRGRTGAADLVDAVIAALKRDLLPALGPVAAAAGAGAVTALVIARRDLASEVEAAEWAALDIVYEPGEGTIRQLATDIRAGTVGDHTHQVLRARLKAVLAAELAVRNPAAVRKPARS